MPGLVRGMARTAAVVGTATATRNAVNRRQADKNVKAYSNAMNEAYPQQTQQQPQYAMQSGGVQPQYVVQPQPEYVEAAPPPQDDVITQLERLGALYAQGILTEEEFAAQKAKLLAM
jgi:hypothetical protein